MAEFVACRGKVFSVPNGSGQGFFKLDGITGTKDAPIFVNGAELSDVDAVAPVLTLGRKKILYSFGEDFGSITITGLILMGTTAGSGLSMVKQWFQERRASAGGEPVNFSVAGGAAYKILVTGMSVSPPDAKLHIQPFGIVGLIAEPK